MGLIEVFRDLPPAGSPEISSRIGQLPAWSGARSAIDAFAPSDPVIATVDTGSSGLSRPPIV